MAEPSGGEPEPAVLDRAVHQDLGDGQADQFGVADPGWPARPLARPEQLIDGDVQCDDEVVEVGAHEAPRVDVADPTPTLGGLVLLVMPCHPRPSTESII
jgi:hypothetical protein